MEATRPRQLVYFTYLAVPYTEGTAYMFFAQDHVSHFVFRLGTERDNSEAATLRQLKKLMKDKDFKTSPTKPFTIITSCGRGFEDSMRAVLRPNKGRLIIDLKTTINATRDFAKYLDGMI